MNREFCFRPVPPPPPEPAPVEVKRPDQTLNIKICDWPVPPPPPEPTPCEIQRLQKKIKAGIKICPKEPPPPQQQAPTCLAICKEKIKNLPIPIKKFDDFVVCIMPREETTQDRCDAILEANSGKPDLPWPGCPVIPPPPPPPTPDPCEIIRKRNRVLECKERKKRYLL